MSIYADECWIEDPVGSERKVGRKAISDFYEGALKLGAKMTLESEIRIAGNEAAFGFRLEADTPNGTLSVRPIDAMVFDDAGKVISMRAFFGPINQEVRPHTDFTNVHVLIPVAASREALWRDIADFAAWHEWHPVMPASPCVGKGVGAIRTLRTPDGGEVPETLEELDHDAYRLVYSIRQSALDMHDYVSTIRILQKSENNCEVDWHGRFRQKEQPARVVAEFLDSFYRSGIEGLKARHERQ